MNQYESVETHWIALYVNNNNSDCFSRFGVEHISKEIEKLVGNKNNITNIYTIQSFDSIMFRYFCIGFTGFMLNGKSLLDYTNSFSPNDYEKHNKNKTKKMKKL